MSIDINWSTFTTGPDGDALALQIRDFIHDKFQRVPLPKFIQSVKVVSFDFGSVAPDVEIKSVGDPYAEFYDDDDDDDDDDGDDDDGDDDDGGEDGALNSAREDERDVFEDGEALGLSRRRQRRRESIERQGLLNRVQSPVGIGGRFGVGLVMGLGSNKPPGSPPPGYLHAPHRPSPGLAGFRSASETFRQGGVSTPLFPFSTPTTSSNLHYFHSALSSGFSGGAATPTAPLPLAGSQNAHSPYNHHPRGGGSSPSSSPSSSLSSLPSPSGSPHPAQQTIQPPPATTTPPPKPRLRASTNDIQITSRVRYTGDIRMELTTELLLDYPARSFVSLPVRLVVTGMSFDGVACLAYIGRKLHFCFLEDEDITCEDGGNGDGGGGGGGGVRGMLKEIRVESEIGEKGKGKQVLKNVGKVERFVLEQVRKIFEEEFVFPSTWTFLV